MTRLQKMKVIAMMFGLMLSGQVYAQSTSSQSDNAELVADKVEVDNAEADKALSDKADSSSLELNSSNADVELWQYTKSRPTISNLAKYLEQFPEGEFVEEAQKKLDTLQTRAQEKAAESKALDAYRKKKSPNGLVLELDPRFNDVKPYVRSMLNSCGYQLVKPHRFAKRVYPSMSINGALFNGRSDSEHSVTLNLSVVLKSKNREIQAREKMLSYRSSLYVYIFVLV